MQLTESELKQIVQEEVEQAIEEGWFDKFRARASGVGKVPGAIKSRAGSAWKQLRTGDSPSQAGSIRGPQSKYAQEKAHKILTLHRNKIAGNVDSALKTHEKLAKDFRADIKDLGLRDPKGPAADKIKQISNQLRNHRQVLKVTKGNLNDLFGGAMDDIRSSEAGAPEAEAEPGPRREPTRASPVEPPSDDQDERYRATMDASRRARDEAEAALEDRPTRVTNVREAKELSQWKKRAGIKEK